MKTVEDLVSAYLDKRENLSATTYVLIPVDVREGFDYPINVPYLSEEQELIEEGFTHITVTKEKIILQECEAFGASSNVLRELTFDR